DARQDAGSPAPAPRSDASAHRSPHAAPTTCAPQRLSLPSVRSCSPRLHQLPRLGAVRLSQLLELGHGVTLRRMRTFQPLDRLSANALDEVSPVRNPHRLGLARVVLVPGVARLALTVTIQLLEPQLRRRPSRSVMPGIPGPAVTLWRIQHTARYA